MHNAVLKIKPVTAVLRFIFFRSWNDQIYIYTAIFEKVYETWHKADVLFFIYCATVMKGNTL